MLEGATATDLVLTITERLRKHGVVGKFVEFFGPGLEHLTIADRATLGNMCPEYGATIAIFPIDAMTLDYLRLTGREPITRRAGRGVREGAGPVPQRGRSGSRSTPKSIELDLATRRAEPGRAEASAGSRVAEAGEERFPDRARRHAGGASKKAPTRRPAAAPRRRWRAKAASRSLRWPTAGSAPIDHGVGRDRGDHQLHEHLEPERDDRRRSGREEGGRARPEAQAVGEDQPRARLEGRHRLSAAAPASTPISTQLGFNLVGYGCTTCIGNSGPLPDEVSARDRVAQSGRRVGAERQPQLRRPHSAAGARELPRVAAAGRRLRAGRAR